MFSPLFSLFASNVLSLTNYSGIIGKSQKTAFPFVFNHLTTTRLRPFFDSKPKREQIALQKSKESQNDSNIALTESSSISATHSEPSCHNLNMLVLASASPRRRELLAQAGFSFEVHPAHIPEDPNPNEDPTSYVTRIAREKAQAVFAQLSAPKGCPPTSAPGLAVLGADTTVTLDNRILGKPSDPADAARILRLLSGRTHRVITGVALVTANSTEVAAEVTAVHFLTLSDEEIASYIATGEPMDKAGAYAIQGRAARWISRIKGDYFNVVGLPLVLVSALLESGQIPTTTANSLTAEAPQRGASAPTR